jgi:hypothetical protein
MVVGHDEDDVGTLGLFWFESKEANKYETNYKEGIDDFFHNNLKSYLILIIEVYVDTGHALLNHQNFK